MGWNGTITDSARPRVGLTFWHDDGVDGREAYLNSTLSIDLQPILDVTSGLPMYGETSPVTDELDGQGDR